MTTMQIVRRLKATVRNGRLVMDEVTDLPEGTELSLVEADTDDYSWVDGLDGVDDPDGLKEALREGDAQVVRGETISADEFLEKLDKRR